MTRLTPAQRRASDPAAHAWVEANAGTGKTHVLTARVLRLLLDGTPADKILCLTYTRAAAAQMANRLQQRLGAWTVMTDEALSADIAALCGGVPDGERMVHARGLFAQVLELPRGLPVQTIHAFCQSLLARFPVEAGVAPTFSLVDEREAASYLVRARDDALATAQADPDGPLAQALDVLAEIVSEHGFGALLPKLVAQRDVLRTAGRRYGAALDDALFRLLGLAPGSDAPALIAAACADGAFDALGLARLAKAFAKGAKGNAAAAARLTDWLAASADARVAGFAAYRRIFLTKDGKPLDKPASQGALAADPGIVPIIDAETARLLALEDSIARAGLARRTAAVLRLGLALVDAFDRIKTSEGLVDYDDLIDKALALLSGSQMASWVLYKLDGGIDHVLIDEAQDTNPAQWQVIDCLMAEFFAGEGAREAMRTVFAVGDVKQSIYGFQGAAPDLFGHYRQRYQRAAQQLGALMRAETLDVSFRSVAAVLDIVDAAFVAEDVHHEPQRAGQGGLVALWPTQKPEPEPGGEAWALPVTPVATRSPEARLADAIADQIARWLESGERLVARGRAMRAGDIMILVRRRNAFCEHMVRALKMREVPVAGIDRLKVNAPLAVRDLMAVAAFALLPEDDYNLAVVLKGPFIGFDDARLFTLAHGRGESTLWQSLRMAAKRNAALAPATAFLRGVLREADYAGPYAFFARLLNDNDGRRRLLARLGAEADDPIDEFLAQCLAYEATHTPSLQGFLAWIEATASEVTRDPDQNADEVRVMTVHGAKGLQAPVVFLPDTCATPPIEGGLYDVVAPDGGRLPLWYRKAQDRIGPLAAARADHEAREAAEHRRLLYVAMTRAEDRLYVAGWDTRKRRPADCWYNVIADAMARVTGCAIDPEALDAPVI
ncbi:MAG: double-strand break repair helicase AddA, partial [Alphaproteobacteria bacterium]